jgi:hypothetical protein
MEPSARKKALKNKAEAISRVQWRLVALCGSAKKYKKDSDRSQKIVKIDESLCFQKLN